MGSPRTKNKAAEAPATPAVTLDQVKQATRADSFVYTSPAFHTELLAQGLVIINPDMTNEAGDIATRATFKDESQVTETQTISQADVATIKAKPVFEITDDVPAPVKKPRQGATNAGRDETYPFSAVEVGKGFFVPGKTAKAMASTVASANARYSEVIEGETRTQTRGKNKGAVVPATRQLRKFIVFDGKNGAGAEGVWIKREA